MGLGVTLGGYASRLVFWWVGVAGFMIFLASRLAGWPLFTLADGTTELVAALVVHTYSNPHDYHR
jgi:hypothetical protein